MRKETGRTNHFQEQFEESQNNLDEVYNQQNSNNRINNQMQKSNYQNQNQAPLQLIKIKSNGDIQLNQQALELINSFNKSVGFVCLAGKYRTGKSFLINKLLNLKGKGFKVDAGTNACTEGIWMWNKPIYSQKEDAYIFFIDTQGSDATNRNSDHDAKIFVLAILISSYFIYNSVGAIDQTSISQLNLVTTLSKRIAISKQGNEDAFSYYMPKFLWLLRDFTLQMKDQRGKTLTPDQYLQNSLSQQNRLIRSNQNVKNIRRALLNYFQDRQCLSLVRPVYQQNEIKNLNNLPDSKLRREFLQGIKQLREKILSNATAKIIKGQKLNALMFTQLLYSLVQVINQDKIPNITSAWQQIKYRAAEQAYEAGIQEYKKLSGQYFATDQPKDQEIYVILKEMRDKALQVYDNYLEQPEPTYRNKLYNILLQKQKNIIKVNNQINEQRNKQLIAQYSQKIKDNLDLRKYDTENFKQLTQDYNNMISRYNQNAKGSTKCQILSNFLQNFNPMLLSSFAQQTTKKYSSVSSSRANDNKLRQEYQRAIKSLEQKNKTLQKQMQSSKITVVQDPKKAAKQAQKYKKLQIQNDKMKKQLESLKPSDAKKECCSIF